jgi:hypothetical protein
MTPRARSNTNLLSQYSGASNQPTSGSGGDRGDPAAQRRSYANT